MANPGAGYAIPASQPPQPTYQHINPTQFQPGQQEPARSGAMTMPPQQQQYAPAAQNGAPQQHPQQTPAQAAVPTARAPPRKKKTLEDDVLVTRDPDEETEDGRIVNRQVCTVYSCVKGIPLVVQMAQLNYLYSSGNESNSRYLDLSTSSRTTS